MQFTGLRIVSFKGFGFAMCIRGDISMNWDGSHHLLSSQKKEAQLGP